ncbi:MAG: hypothetical protein PsegKO_34760 [Pseudohongiellaceae bacterium]
MTPELMLTLLRRSTFPVSMPSGELLGQLDDAGLRQLLQAGVLLEAAPLLLWGGCRDCHCPLGHRQILRHGDEALACCPLDLEEEIELDPESLRVYSVRQPELVRWFSKYSGLSSEPVQLGSSLWLLASRPTAVVLLLDHDVLDSPGLVGFLHRHCGSPVRLLVPSLLPRHRMLLAEQDSIHLTDLADVLDRRGALSLDALTAPARCIVDLCRGSVELDGQEISLGGQLITLFYALAEAVTDDRPLVTLHELEERLWGDAAVVAARPVRDVMRDLKNALRRGGLPQSRLRELFSSSYGRGYTLNLPASEIQFVD